MNILKRTAADGNAVRPAMTDPNRESEKQKAVTTHHGFPWTSQCTITTQKYSDRGQKVNLFKDLNPLTCCTRVVLNESIIEDKSCNH